jgi:effector-binding domain-containing protein
MEFAAAALMWGAAHACKENLMPVHFCLRAISRLTITLAAFALIATLSATQAFAQSAQSPAPNPPAAAPAPAAPAPGTDSTSQSGDPFGQNLTLAGKTVVYVKGTGSWDKAFETITAAFKKIDAYLDKEGIKANGLPMTIFTATDDTGFDFQAEVPIAEAPKNPPHGDMAVGQSPEGTALKFVHRGSYDDLDNTYEAITNYLDDKKLEAKDLFIEEYVTDPVKSDTGKLVINVYVLIKPPQTAPG